MLFYSAALQPFSPFFKWLHFDVSNFPPRCYFFSDLLLLHAQVKIQNYTESPYHPPYRFRSCLRMVNSANADMVGRFFFNFIRIPCFTISRTTECTSWTWWGRCIQEEEKQKAIIRQPLSYNWMGSKAFLVML